MKFFFLYRQLKHELIFQVVLRDVSLPGIVLSKIKTYVSSKSKINSTWEFKLKVELHKKEVLQVARKYIACGRNQNFISKHKQDEPNDWKQSYSVIIWA